MSSANLVEVIGVPEATYGTTPPLATATGVTMRFTSETLSGTPTTVESAEMRTDRMSSGQVVVGLETGGQLSIELSRDPTYDLLFSMGLMNNWITGATGTDTAPYTVSGTKQPACQRRFHNLQPRQCRRRRPPAQGRRCDEIVGLYQRAEQERRPTSRYRRSPFPRPSSSSSRRAR